MRFGWLASLSPRTIIVVNLLATMALTWLGTQFHYPEEVLAVSSWGGGVPSTSTMTAFATARPWWHTYGPEGVKVRPDGGVEPLVRIPRKDIIALETPNPPTRGIGYDALGGLVTAVRSGVSPDLVFDFPLLINLQQWALVLAWTLLPVGLYWLVDGYRSPIIFLYFNIASLALLVLRPNKAKYLTEGIVDSSLANALALGAVLALWTVVRSGRMETGRHRWAVLFSGLYLSFCTLVRGEFLFLLAIFFFFFFILAGFRFKEIRKGVFSCFLLIFLFPIAYGFFNSYKFGHFVPLRMQTGQNLLEPIGQYPNPFGIEYRDEWVMAYLEKEGIEYISFEADRVLTRRYFELLAERPGVFLKHFYLRLTYFSKQFGYILHPWTLPFVLFGILYFSLKSKKISLLCIPFYLAICYFLFFGWTNNLLRLVTPIHFLLNAFLSIAFVGWMVHRQQRKEKTLGINDNPEPTHVT